MTLWDLWTSSLSPLRIVHMTINTMNGVLLLVPRVPKARQRFWNFSLWHHQKICQILQSWRHTKGARRSHLLSLSSVSVEIDGTIGVGGTSTTSNFQPCPMKRTWDIPLKSHGSQCYKWGVCMSHDKGESSWDKPKWDASNIMRNCFISQSSLSTRGTLSTFQ